MRWLEKILINVPALGEIVKASLIAESIGVVTHSNWYLFLGFIGCSPIVLAYRRLYKEALITAIISFVLAPIMGYGALSKLFNTGMTLVTMVLFQNHIKTVVVNAIGKNTEEKITYVQNALKPDLAGAIASAIIYIGILAFIGNYGYFN
ncbi:MAG: hypothetical protein ACRC0Y_04700 [Fusobacteriaceae bacterium]